MSRTHGEGGAREPLHQPPDPADLRRAPPASSECAIVRGRLRDFADGDLDDGARVAVELVSRLVADPLPADTILNVNVPDRAWAEVAGFEVTRLGHRHRAEPCVPQIDPRGRQVWWIGPAGPEQDAGPGTDFDALRRGCVSITPIQVDLTRYPALETVAGWVDGLAQGLARR